MKKILLAYSGGLDTSCILTWLKEKYGVPVVAYCADVGQNDDLSSVNDKAMKTGAQKCIVEDLKSVFVENYIFPAIKSNAVDIVRADVSWKGGITGTLKVCHLAEAHGMNCELHTTTMGPSDVANIHVACAVRNSEYFELFVPEDTFQAPMKQSLISLMDSQGDIHVPDGPGLGIEIDWDLVDNSCTSRRVFKAASVKRS